MIVWNAVCHNRIEKFSGFHVENDTCAMIKTESKTVLWKLDYILDQFYKDVSV